MKITNSLFETNQYIESMTKVHQSPKLSVMDAYRINRLVKSINELNTEYNELKKGILTKFGEVVPPEEATTPAPVEGIASQEEWRVLPGNQEEFLKEMQELLSIEHDLETERLPFPSKIDEGITVSDIDVLNIFFDFGFDEDKTE